MATNDFLPFANGSGANVLAQPDYAALTSLLANGFSSGTAQSQQLNKVWRQSSIMSAVLAQLIADVTGASVVDDGTTSTILGNLLATLLTASSAADSSTAANVITVSYTPAITALTDRMAIRVKAANANTGATTISVNGLAAVPVQGPAGALQGGELLAGGIYELIYVAASSVFVLTGQTAGSQQVANATQSQQAVALEQARQLCGGHVTTINGVAGGTSVSLTLANAGLVIIDCTNGTVDVTLPLANALAAVEFRFIRIDASTNAATVHAAGTDTIGGVASVQLIGQLSGLPLTSDGVGTWREQGRGNAALPLWTANATDSQQAVALGQFLGTGLTNLAGGTAGSNVIKIPFWDGAQIRTLLIQSVTTYVAAASYASSFSNFNITWPIAFPNALLSSGGTHAGGQTASTYSNYTFENANLSGGTHIISFGAAVTLTQTFTAFAIGY